MNREEQGLLIAVEGIDGSGKTTLLKTIARYLQEKGIRVFALPSGGFSPSDVEARLREIAVAENSGIVKETEALLYISALAQKVGQYIQPARREYQVVIVDRLILSTLVFARCMHGMDANFADACLKYASGGLKPDFTFLCDIGEDIAYSRMVNRGTPLTKREKRGQAFMHALRKSFLELLPSTTDKYAIIDTGRTPIEELENSIKVLDEYVKR